MNQQWHRYFRHYADTIFPEFAFSRRWNYKDDICMLGEEMLWHATGEELYRQSVIRCGQALCNESGQLAFWDDQAHNLDFISFGKSLWTLYRMTDNGAYAAAAAMIRENLEKHPRVSTGNYWHKDIYPHQVWLDGLYMALPFQAQCALYSGKADFSDILNQFRQVRHLHWVAEKRLYIHAWDESRQMEWADAGTGRSPCFWLRAEGWLLMALCDVYELLHPVCGEASELKTLLQEALEGLMPYQDGDTRMFLQLIDRDDLKDNYPETSGSAMAAYAMMKGARLGMLDDAMAARGAAVLEGIRTTYLRGVDVPVLHGICASAGLGPGPDHRTDRDGSPAYYLSEKQIADNQHGTATCMMAAAELLLWEKQREGTQTPAI